MRRPPAGDEVVIRLAAWWDLPRIHQVTLATHSTRVAGEFVLDGAEWTTC